MITAAASSNRLNGRRPGGLPRTVPVEFRAGDVGSDEGETDDDDERTVAVRLSSNDDEEFRSHGLLFSTVDF